MGVERKGIIEDLEVAKRNTQERLFLCVCVVLLEF